MKKLEQKMGRNQPIYMILRGDVPKRIPVEPCRQVLGRDSEFREQTCSH